MSPNWKTKSVDNTEYIPTRHFDNVNNLFGNHYRFAIDALPDLTFFVQNFVMPSVSSTSSPRHNPFVRIPEVGDHLHFAPFTVTYIVDNSFKSYFSLYFWLKGYGFPTSYNDIEAFRIMRTKQIGNPRPNTREIQKTNALLTVLQPDNDSPIAEVAFYDVFPTTLDEMTFETVGSEPSLLTCRATFDYTDFLIRLTNP
jgi:hypothetical protein